MVKSVASVPYLLVHVCDRELIQAIVSSETYTVDINNFIDDEKGNACWEPAAAGPATRRVRQTDEGSADWWRPLGQRGTIDNNGTAESLRAPLWQMKALGAHRPTGVRGSRRIAVEHRDPPLSCHTLTGAQCDMLPNMIPNKAKQALAQRAWVVDMHNSVQMPEREPPDRVEVPGRPVPPCRSGRGDATLVTRWKHRPGAEERH